MKKYKKKNRNQKKKLVEDVKLADERIIYINEEIDDALARRIIETLLKMDAISHEPITIYINSPGGSIVHGNSIIEIIGKIKSQVNTICIGRCSSFAVVLLLSGNHRSIGRHSELMIHEASSWLMGSVSNLKDDFHHVQILNNRLARYIAERTKLSYSQVKKYIKRKDYYFSSKEALECGFVDEILN